VTITDLTRQHPEKARPSPDLAWDKVGEPITAPITPGPPDIIDGLIPRNGQLLIAGETNIGKSLVALEICHSLTSGEALWGDPHRTPTIKAGRILYVLGEHYNDVIKRLAIKTALPFTDAIHIYGPEDLKADKWLVQNGKQNVEGIQKLVTAAKGCDLVIFDPLAAFFVGTDQENDNPGMRVVLDTLNIVTQSNGASCIILAHLGKPSMGKDGQEYTRSKYAIRGASGIEDAATNIFYMSQSGGSSAASKDGDNIFSIRKRKYKGDAPDEYRLLRNKDTLTHTILGSPRPFIEARKIETQAKVARLQANFPDMSMKEIIKVVSVTEGFHENTIRNYLGAI
jgi:hypothetical protein